MCLEEFGDAQREEAGGRLGRGGPGRAQQMLGTEWVLHKCFLHEKIHYCCSFAR